MRPAIRFVPFALVLGVAAVNAAEPAGAPVFDIWEYAVEGNTVLGAETIEKAVYSFLGEGKTLDDVERARSQLDKAYRDSGYATVAVIIPEQSVASGVVRLEVVEGRVDRLHVTGARYHAQERIIETVAALDEGMVPHFPEVERQLAEVNQSADRRVTPVLRPGRLPGTTEVELKVEDHLPLHAGVELNNRYSPSRAPNPSELRATASLRYDNLWQRGHSLSLSYQSAPEKPEETRVLVASYAMPIGRAGDALAWYAVHSRSNSDLHATLPDAGVIGSGDIVGLRWNHALASLPGPNQSLSLGLDYKHLGESLHQGSSATFETPLTYWLGVASYSASLADSSGETAFGAGFSFSPRGLRHNDEQFAQKRYLGQGNFGVFKGEVQRDQKLPADFRLSARIEGQAATLPLPSSEQLAIGGADSVRGYPEATQVGDSGIRGLLELRAPKIAFSAAPQIEDLRFLAFIEGAAVHIRSPLPGQKAGFSLAGAGLGLRLKAWRGFSLALDYGVRLKDGLTQDTHGALDKGGGRLHLNASYQY